MDKNLLLAEIWDEWFNCSIKSHITAEAEASGLLMGMKHNHITFTTTRLKSARRLAGKLWPLTSYAKKYSLGLSMITRKDHKPSVRFTCPEDILFIPDENENDMRLIWSWLKGLWGSTGGLYFPKAGYYLTLIISDKSLSERTNTILELTGLSWNYHRNEFTLRNHDDVTTFLYNAGMPSGALALEDMSIIRSARSKANTARNYDAANIARSVKAAHQQLILARKILAEGILEALPDKLREIVEIRIKYPDSTLEELGEKLTPKIKKSAVKYRWKKIHELIQKI